VESGLEEPCYGYAWSMLASFKFGSNAEYRRVRSAGEELVAKNAAAVFPVPSSELEKAA
jgi:hypothetical protein